MRKAFPSIAKYLPIALVTSAALCLGALSCKKYEDKPGPDDPRLTRPYCNDPEAVNYNWDFPGKPDNTVCRYPSDIFAGRYAFTDSVYNSANSLVLQRQYTLDLVARSRSQMALLGFCGPTDTVRMTATRFFRATVDTTIEGGQPFCRPLDTLSGYITRTAADERRLKFFFAVVSDTGLTYHRGTAVKQ